MTDDPQAFDFERDACEWLDNLAINALRRTGLTDLDKLAAESFKRMCQIRNVGSLRLQRIAVMLKHYGYDNSAWVTELDARAASGVRWLPSYDSSAR